jgi:DNA-binding transcriptional LysR family regulator
MRGELFCALAEERHDLVFAKRLSGSQRGRVVRTEPLHWCVGRDSPLTGGESVLPLALHPEPSVSRARMLEVLKACNRSYKIVVESSSIAVLKATVIAGLAVSAFAEYVIPEGLQRLETDLPPLGMLEYVIDRPAKVSNAVLALEAVLTDVAQEL